MSKVKKYLPVNILLVLSVSALVWLDQLTKRLAVDRLKGKDAFSVIDGILELQYAENRGAAFGIFQNRQIGLVIVTVAVMSVVLFFYETAPSGKRFVPLRVSYLLIIAGAVGNMIDRVSQSYVVDFIYIKIIDFPNFNVADMCVTSGCFLMILLMLFFYKDGERLCTFRKEGADRG